MILILGALDQEIKHLLSIANIDSSSHWGPFSIHTCTIENQAVCLVKCGVGKVLSSMLTQHLIDKFKPTHILFTGLAGALNSKFNIGDVVLGTECIQHDIDASALGFKRGLIPYTEIYSIKCDANLLKIARTFDADTFAMHEGRLLTGDQFIAKSEEHSHQYLISELNGDAVDMEGASVAIVAMINEIPCLIVRTISDKADGESPKNFDKFLPVASKHSVLLIRHILKNLQSL